MCGGGGGRGGETWALHWAAGSLVGKLFGRVRVCGRRKLVPLGGHAAQRLRAKRNLRTQARSSAEAGRARRRHAAPRGPRSEQAGRCTAEPPPTRGLWAAATCACCLPSKPWGAVCRVGRLKARVVPAGFPHFRVGTSPGP